MKHTRFAVYSAAAIVLLFALLTVSGCGGGGGGVSNTVTSPYRGSLDGVATSPVDQDTNAPLDAWINVYWLDTFAPPRQFTVTLEKEETPGNWGGVHTRLSAADSNPANADWWFQPTSDFSPYTWYRIVIRATGEPTVYVYFETSEGYVSSFTRSTGSASTAKPYRPAGATNATGEDSVMHTITRTK